MIQPSRIERCLNPLNRQHEPITVSLAELVASQHRRCRAADYQRLEGDRP
jgi:hypothetical protein